MENHEHDLRAVLETLKKYELVTDPKKVHLFMQEVEFCGHILREGRRSPAPGKLLAIRKWEMPRTVTALRGFLGLTNYYSCYVPNYADLAAPLMGKLQPSRSDGKKGSQKAIEWTPDDVIAFKKPEATLANLWSYSGSTICLAHGCKRLGGWSRPATRERGRPGPCGVFQPQTRWITTQLDTPGKGNVRHCGCPSQVGGVDWLSACDPENRSQALGVMDHRNG